MFDVRDIGAHETLLVQHLLEHAPNQIESEGLGHGNSLVPCHFEVQIPTLQRPRGLCSIETGRGRS